MFWAGGNAHVPPLQEVTVPCNIVNLLHHLQCSGAGSGDPLGVPLIDHGTPCAVDKLCL